MTTGEATEPPKVVTEGLTEHQEDLVIQLLGMVGAHMSAAFYNAAARLFALTAIETVILREREGIMEVFLAPRPADDVH